MNTTIQITFWSSIEDLVQITKNLRYTRLPRGGQIFVSESTEPERTAWKTMRNLHKWKPVYAGCSQLGVSSLARLLPMAHNMQKGCQIGRTCYCLFCVVLEPVQSIKRCSCNVIRSTRTPSCAWRKLRPNESAFAAVFIETPHSLITPIMNRLFKTSFARKVTFILRRNSIYRR